jgi:hypothetical protein
MKSLNRTPKQCQPCDAFKAHEQSMIGGAQPHQCPICGGTRYFCGNCYTDHHEGGWNSCTHSSTGDIAECPRAHPVCKEVYAKQRKEKAIGGMLRQNDARDRDIEERLKALEELTAKLWKSLGTCYACVSDKCDHLCVGCGRRDPCLPTCQYADNNDPRAFDHLYGENNEPAGT